MRPDASSLVRVLAGFAPAVALAACFTWAGGSDPAAPSCVATPRATGVFIDAILQDVLVTGDKHGEDYSFTSSTHCEGCSLAGLRESFLAGYRQEVSVTGCTRAANQPAEASLVTLTQVLPPQPVSSQEAVITGPCGTHKDYCVITAGVSMLWVLPSTTVDPSGDYTSLSALPTTGYPMACAEFEGFSMDAHAVQASRIKLRKAVDGVSSCGQ